MVLKGGVLGRDEGQISQQRISDLRITLKEGVCLPFFFLPYEEEEE